MNSRPTLNRPHFLSLAFIIAGVAFLIWPTPEQALPTIIDHRNASADQINNQALRAEKAQALFDFASLPAAPAPEPRAPNPAAIDPTAAIKRYKLVGVSVNEQGALALLSDGFAHFTIAVGDKLAGFTVTKISPRRIEFEKESIAATLSLPDHAPHRDTP